MDQPHHARLMEIRNLSLSIKCYLRLLCVNSVEGGYTVTFANGRRGSTLREGTKTPAPVTIEKAEKIYRDLVARKRAKGYTQGADGTPFHDISSMLDSGGTLPTPQ